MTEPVKYASAAAFRMALEERLNRTARETSQDVQRLRKQIAFDRLLARLFAGNLGQHLVIKGGYAMELRLHRTRTTKDIDLCLDNRTGSQTSESGDLRSMIQEASEIDLEDFREFFSRL
ncbi:MAG: nucleotidyl transferase AbiEii/AbiGii toxin family protein [Chitinispirillaceae bacterium]|nr:nucleotidyl transferase AbiEii/AbiGii toxin family protein [Chitinispirillaceae bacterium]